MNKGNKAIGVFDSGVGGVTVLSALKSLIPGEDYIYFGDTGRVPYGSKSPEVVVDYSVQIANFLKEQDVKAIVIACNTSTARAGKILEDLLDIPVIGVIKAAVKDAVATSRNGKIGIIGTRNTISSEAHKNAILSLNPLLEIYARECPMIVPYIEEAEEDSLALKSELKRYLGPLTEKGIDTLVLGCTHYPLINDKIREVIGAEIALIDPSVATANETYDVLQNLGEINEKKDGNISFYITGGVNEFQTQLKRFGMPNVYIYQVEITKLKELPTVHKAKAYSIKD